MAGGPGPAEEAEPTLDEVHSEAFSRPPYSELRQSMLVYYTGMGICVLDVLLVLVGMNLDLGENRKRLARAIVPVEMVRRRLLCLRCTAPQESHPCAVAEQYYLDPRLLELCSPEEVANRKRRTGLVGYLLDNAQLLPDALLRDHLVLSLPHVIPTFSRVKRTCLLVVQLHLCALVVAMALNVREHQAPAGSYRLFSCPGGGALDDEPCLATVPRALAAGAVATPLFRLLVLRPARLACLIPQGHPSRSRFPLGERKFARVLPRTVIEMLTGRTAEHDMRVAAVLKDRSFSCKVVRALWQATCVSSRDLQFYGQAASLLIWVSLAVAAGAAGVYVMTYTLYLEDAAVFHWLAGLCVMYGSWALAFDPLWLASTQVVWASVVQAVAQSYCYGPHAVSAMAARHAPVLRGVEEGMLATVRDVGARRVQRWWTFVLEARREEAARHPAATEEVSRKPQKQAPEKQAAGKRGTAASGTAASSKPVAAAAPAGQGGSGVKQRRWCLRLEVQSCEDIEDLGTGDGVGGEQSPFVRLKCDMGNPATRETKVAWNAGTSAAFGDVLWFDVKDGNALHVEVWCKGADFEEFGGRGIFRFGGMRGVEQPEGHAIRVPLSRSSFRELAAAGAPAEQPDAQGCVHIQATFLDPQKDDCRSGAAEGEDWMMPKHRMSVSLGQMGQGAKGRVGSMLSKGLLADGAAATSEGTGDKTAVKPPVQAHVGGPLEDFLVDNTFLQSGESGLAYHRSRNQNDQVVPPRLAPWGSTVRGFAEDGQWVRVEEPSGLAFLPFKANGMLVLRELRDKPAVKPLVQAQVGGPVEDFLVDNTFLQSGESGLAYCRSRSENDHVVPPRLAPWGSTVQGSAEEGRWVRVEEPSGIAFLPFKADGMLVLRQLRGIQSEATGGNISLNPAARVTAGTNAPLSAAPVQSVPGAVPDS